MKNRDLWFFTGVSIGALSLTMVRRYRKRRNMEILTWQKQRCLDLDVLACPECRGVLIISPLPEGEGLHCRDCQIDYLVVDGIPQFILQKELTGMNKRFAQMYDWFSWIYVAFGKIGFAYIGMNEETARREITDRLDPQGGRILEVSIGPGVNLPYLVGRSDVGGIYGLDISPGQLNRCRDYVAHQNWDVHLDLGNAEQLPYQDNSFDGVFHIGGINFFNDKKAAIEEMIRVAKPGARILIADETEKGARAYEKIIPIFKDSFGGNRKPIVAPLDLVPPEMLETRLSEAWKGWLYCLEFRKP